MTQPEPPGAEPGFGTPYDRSVAALRAFARTLTRGDGQSAAFVGARHVHLGLRLAAVGMGAIVLGSLLTSAGWQSWWLARTLGALAASFLIGAGVLASSRIARALMLMQGLGYVVAVIPMLLALHRFPTLTSAAGAAGMAAAMLTFAVGAVLANLTPAARAWHREQASAKAARRARKGKTLADWRAGPREQHADG